MENSYARSAHGQMLPWLRALATLVFFTALSWQADAQSCCQVNIPSASVQNGCVVLDSPHSGSCGDQVEWMWAENGLSEQLKVISSQELRDSYGNIITTKKAILPAFSIGDDRLENLEIGFFEGQIAQQKISLIGAGLLRKFNIIIDAKRNFIYLKQIEVEHSPN